MNIQPKILCDVQKKNNQKSLNDMKVDKITELNYLNTAIGSLHSHI